MAFDIQIKDRKSLFSQQILIEEFLPLYILIGQVILSFAAFALLSLSLFCFIMLRLQVDACISLPGLDLPHTSQRKFECCFLFLLTFHLQVGR